MYNKLLPKKKMVCSHSTYGTYAHPLMTVEIKMICGKYKYICMMQAVTLIKHLAHLICISGDLDIVMKCLHQVLMKQMWKIQILSSPLMLDWWYHPKPGWEVSCIFQSEAPVSPDPLVHWSYTLQLHKKYEPSTKENTLLKYTRCSLSPL